QLRQDYEEEHQPMTLALIAMLAYQTGQVQVSRQERDAEFLLRLTAGARVGRFTFIRVQFSAAGTPQPEIWLLGPLQQKDFVLVIETIKERSDLVRQGHGRNEG